MEKLLKLYFNKLTQKKLWRLNKLIIIKQIELVVKNSTKKIPSCQKDLSV